MNKEGKLWSSSNLETNKVSLTSIFLIFNSEGSQAFERDGLN